MSRPDVALHLINVNESRRLPDILNDGEVVKLISEAGCNEYMLANTNRESALAL